jgi:BrxA
VAPARVASGDNSQGSREIAAIRKAADTVAIGPYTTRLQKGGALLADMRLLVRSWDTRHESDRHRLPVLENILGKPSRARAKDTYRRAFLPRFIHGDPPEAWRVVRPLERRDFPLEIVRPVYYWVTVRSEPLLRDFVLEKLPEFSSTPYKQVRVDEACAWVERKLKDAGQHWSPIVALKVARGLLSALRDFGILKGRARKQVAPAYLPLESFAYIAFALHRLGASGERLLTHPDWRLFLLPAKAVELLFLEAHQYHFLGYQAAGRIIRVDFTARDYEEMADVLLR